MAKKKTGKRPASSKPANSEAANSEAVNSKPVSKRPEKRMWTRIAVLVMAGVLFLSYVLMLFIK